MPGRSGGYTYCGQQQICTYVSAAYLEAARGGLVGRLVVPSDEVHLLREGRLEGDKVQGDLAREEPPVHVVAQEKVLPVGRLRKSE